MAEDRNERILERLDRLEKEVSELRQALEKLKSAEPHKIRAASPPPPLSEKAALQSHDSPVEALRKSESWLNRIGIALFLIGLAFLFKYSVEQGWLTPWVRVGFGLAAGLSFLLLGLRLYSLRPRFSQVLLGGAIAAFYTTGFAAFQFYALVSYGMAVVFMSAVTIASFYLSVRQRVATLSVIATLGGFGTPFLLYTGSGSAVGFVLYASVILAGATAIYWKGYWESLLWTSYAGEWMVLLIGCTGRFFQRGEEASVERWALQIGILIGWAVFAAIPVAAERLQTKLLLASVTSALLTILTAPVALGLSMLVWPFAARTWGWIAIAAAAFYLLVSITVSKQTLRSRVAFEQALVSVLLFTIALILLLDGDVLVAALTAEAVALHVASSRFRDWRIGVGGHVLFAVLSLVLIDHFLSALGKAEQVVLDRGALSDLLVISGGVVSSLYLASEGQVRLYRILAHLFILAWFLREFSPLTNGAGIVTSAWIIYAVILLIMSIRLSSELVRKIAMGTLFLAVGKLFLIDLSRIEALWRILLFLGFGGLLLLLSYSLRILRPHTAKTPE